MDKEKCIDICNSLLRGELSALETYDQAIDKFIDEPQVADLRTLKSEHIKSVNLLKANVQKMGAVPSASSGAWGSFATAVTGAAKLLGDSPALNALKEGEEHGKSEYESALEDEDVMLECKDMIRNELLPRQIQHIRKLDSLIATV